MTEDGLLRVLPLADRLRIAAVDLALTGAPQALVEAVWEASGARGAGHQARGGRSESLRRVGAGA